MKFNKKNYNTDYQKQPLSNIIFSAVSFQIKVSDNSDSLNGS